MMKPADCGKSSSSNAQRVGNRPSQWGHWLEIISGGYNWLVVSAPLKNTTSSVGVMTFPIYGKTKFMFQTTNQYNMDLL